MKKLDKLILQSFLGRFVVVAGVMLFIFLAQYMIKNFKHFVGKDLGFDVLSQLFFYFGLIMVPVTLPISMLLSSLMAFGTLGEHSELTAIKSSGTSMLRILRPVALVALLTTAFLLVYNEYVLPTANLQAYSLLYDVKQKKPTLDLQEGVFYNGIEGYSIKVEKKDPDGQGLQKVMIYDHNRGKGNTDVIVAEKGIMEMVKNDQYLSLTLIDGTSTSEVDGEAKKSKPKKGEKPKSTTITSKKRDNSIQFVRNVFDTARIMFSMESFGMSSTDKKLFLGHNIMKHQPQMMQELDSVKEAKIRQKQIFMDNIANQLVHHGLSPEVELAGAKVKEEDKAKENKRAEEPISATVQERDSLLKNYRVALNSYNRANNTYNMARTQLVRSESTNRSIAQYMIDIFRRYTQPIAIFVMFLIGAPLGAIIKKGGLGVPVIVCVIFFVIYYISTLTGEKYARELVVVPAAGVWASNVFLSIIGLFFLVQAKNDVRLFEFDYYQVLWNRLTKK